MFISRGKGTPLNGNKHFICIKGLKYLCVRGRKWFLIHTIHVPSSELDINCTLGLTVLCTDSEIFFRANWIHEKKTQCPHVNHPTPWLKPEPNSSTCLHIKRVCVTTHTRKKRHGNNNSLRSPWLIKTWCFVTAHPSERGMRSMKNAHVDNLVITRRYYSCFLFGKLKTLFKP